MKYIMCSRTFPASHPRKGEPTWFVEKIWNCFREDLALPDNFRRWVDSYIPLIKGDGYLKSTAIREIKPQTIRNGSRFSPGEMVSLRVWEGRPYHTDQIEFAQVEVKQTWSIEINNRFGAGSFEVVINGVVYAQLHFGNDKDLNRDGLITLAKNDGLELDDFVSWFNMHPKKKEAFRGQIICWGDGVEY